MRKSRIKFSLEMRDGEQARDIDTLREYFDTEKIVGYFQDGKLLTWLEDRFLDDEAEAVRGLSNNEPNLGKRLSEILGVAANVEDVDPETVAWRNERLARLKQYTNDPDILASVDNVAFDQEDFEDIMHEEELPPTVYLCGNTFTFPSGILKKKNIRYVGVGKNVTAVIKSNTPIDFAGKGVAFENLAFDSAYEEVLKNQSNYENTPQEMPISFNKSRQKDSQEIKIAFLSELAFRLLKKNNDLSWHDKVYFLFDHSLPKSDISQFNENAYKTIRDESIIFFYDIGSNLYAGPSKVAFTDKAIYGDTDLVIRYSSIKEINFDKNREGYIKIKTDIMRGVEFSLYCPHHSENNIVAFLCAVSGINLSVAETTLKWTQLHTTYDGRSAWNVLKEMQGLKL